MFHVPRGTLPGDDMRLLAIAVCLAVATTGYADNVDHYADQHGWLIENTEWDIFVATVQGKDDAEATNRKPPVVSLHVDEVLRGTIPAGPFTAEWSVFYGFRCGNESQQEREMYRAWLSRPLPGPVSGSRWLFGGYRGISGVYVLHPNARYEFDPALVKWVRKAIAEAAHRPTE